MEIKVLHNTKDMRFYIPGDNKDKGEMTYLIRGNIMTINHTYVDPAYRGQNYARILVDAGVNFARNGHLKINPTCSYALKIVSQDYPELMI